MPPSEALMEIHPAFLPGCSLALHPPGIVDRLMELNVTYVNLETNSARLLKHTLINQLNTVVMKSLTLVTGYILVQAIYLFLSKPKSSHLGV